MTREAKKEDLNALLQLYLYLHEQEIPEDSQALREAWDTIMEDENHHIILNVACLLYTSNSLCFQIGHTAAFITDKMVMRMSIRVKMIYTVSDTQPGYLTQIGKQSQIPVNGSKTDVGKFCPYIAVNYICRRMVVSGHQETFDGFPLTAVFQHVIPPPFCQKR